MKKYIFYIVIAVLILSNIFTFLYIRHQHIHMADYETKYALIDPHRQFHDNADMIVNIEELRKYLRALPEQNKDWAEMSIYFEYLNTGANVAVNPELPIWPASLTKLPVAMVAMKQVEKGVWSLEETNLGLITEPTNSAIIPEAQAQPEQKFLLKDLIQKLLTDSDNLAYSILVSNLNQEELDSIGGAVGTVEFFTPEGKISAKEYTRLLRALYTATYLNEENSTKLLTFMIESPFREFLNSNIPPDIKFAHKWGVNIPEKVYSDSGIVYIKNRPYMISVMIQSKESNEKIAEQKIKQLMADIGQRTYNFINNYQQTQK